MNKMFYLLFTAVVFTSCQKKQHCYARTAQVPAYLSFVGFDTASLDTIYVQHYEADGTFTHLGKTDSIYTTGMRMQHDTCTNIFTEMSYGSDYKIIIPATGRIFQVTNIISRTNDSVEDMGSYKQCSTYGVITSAPVSATIDGAQVPTVQTTGAPSHLYLHQ